jgi:hypothetical protein
MVSAQKVQVLPQLLGYPVVLEKLLNDTLSLFVEQVVISGNQFRANNHKLNYSDNLLNKVEFVQTFGGLGHGLYLKRNQVVFGYVEHVNLNGLLEHGVLSLNISSGDGVRVIFQSDTSAIGVLWYPVLDTASSRYYLIGNRIPLINGVPQSSIHQNICLLILDNDLEVFKALYWNIPGQDQFIDLVRNDQNLYLIFRVLDAPPTFPGIGNGAQDIAIMKITNDTTVEWLKTYGTSNAEFFSSSLRNKAVFHNGHLYFQFRCDTGTCLMKVDEDGNLIESKEYSVVGYDGFFQNTLNVRPGHDELVHTGLVQEYSTGNLIQNGGLIVFDEDLNVKQARKIGTPTGEDYILQSLVFFDDGSFVSTAGASTYYGGPLLFYSDENLNTGCLDMGPLEVTVQDYPMNVLDYHFPTLHHQGWYYDTLYTTTDTYTMSDACYCEGNIEGAAAGANQSICNGTFTWLGSAVNPSELIYQWSPGTGLEDPNSPFTRAAPQQTTTYTLTVIDTTGLNCYRTREIQVTVTVNNCETGEFIVMPSPNNGTFNVHHGAFFGHLNIELSVYDVRGRLVWQQPLSGQQPNTEVVLPPHVATGMYVVRAKSEQFEREVKMVVMR